MALIGRPPVHPHIRYWAKVEKGEGCWFWTGGKNTHRYGYLLEHGTLPEGLNLDHICRNRGCVRPDHLEPVTCRENILRGEGVAAKNAKKTHCKNGHPFAGDNLVTYYWRGEVTRICRTCRNKAELARHHRRKHGQA